MSNLNLIPIGKLFDLEKGSLQSSKCTEGEYTFITAAEEWKTHNEYSHECEALIFAAAASGSLGRTHYINDKFITSDLCFILTPKDSKKYPINLKFYHFVFNSLKDEIVKNTKSGTSKESINQSNLRNYEIPYFEIDKQNLWIDKLVNTKSIKEDLELELSTGQSLLKQLKQTILQEAIEGKLTAQWRAKNPDIGTAKKLLEQIKTEKDKLIKEKKIRPSKPLSPINEDEIPFDIPQSWEWCRLGEIANGFQYGTSTKSKINGKVPVLRMGNIQNGRILLEELVYTDNESEIEKYSIEYNDLLFNRTNSRELVGKTAIYSFQEKAIYAGYLIKYSMILSNSHYINYVMNSIFHYKWCTKVRSDALGQSNINATKLQSYIVPLPPLEEQKEIVATIEKLFILCNELESEINQNKVTVDNLMATVLKEAFETKENIHEYKA
ncbi:restriction endonuclease subunit S [Aliarcobacter cryaerophilus]|uniref:restriction endonuclease subunit S n=1 Tax=Aliarcobacter cryaerophilus TaxID=28198 RepID=UPI0021B520FC|nr:restriction endonuclease subunit S [Aliarcobacter cryaerophilus]MCT7546550.1 restriction endonuclease subunit S [Aliarcobacter cryaerophilus]